MRAQVFFFTLSQAPNKASKRKAYEADQLLEHGVTVASGLRPGHAPA